MKYLAYSVGGQQLNFPGGIKTAGLTDSQSIVTFIIQFLLATSTILAMAYLIYGGIRYMTSGGESAKIQSARSHIIYALLGLFLCFLAFFIVEVLGYFFNVPLLNP